MNRKDFLQLTATLAIGAPLAGMIQSCSSGYVLYAVADGPRVTIPAASLPDLAQPNSFVKVYVDRFANPIVLFEGEGKKIYAVLTTCSHSGCEVRKLRTKFECPCHGSEYDLQGHVVRGPAPDALETFEVLRREEVIEILLG
jgi:cytochrome b6-f complex iron-sulfur subunit